MSMILLKNLPCKRTQGGHLRSMALFLCTECKSKVVRELKARDYHSCGCTTEFKKFRQKGKALTERRCLKCGKPFMSEGNHNRKCESCKQVEDWYGETFERKVYRSTIIEGDCVLDGRETAREYSCKL